jgi:hypothetical protein
MHSMVYDPQQARDHTNNLHSDMFSIMSCSAHCAHLHIFAHINSDLDSVFHNLFICIIFILIQPRWACNMHECASKKQYKCA